MYSALKHGGRPLYAIAREGREVPRAARRVRVHELQQIGFDGLHLDLRVRCSKGTYVRTLVEDIGRALGCGAHLASLRRVAAARFRIESAVTLEALAGMDAAGRDRLLLPPGTLLEGLPRVDLPPALAERFRRGQALQLGEAPQGRCAVYGAQGLLLGLGEGLRGGELRARRLIHHASG
jgi:tRNA pseudouridine55 synthase